MSRAHPSKRCLASTLLTQSRGYRNVKPWNGLAAAMGANAPELSFATSWHATCIKDSGALW
jgi:hypothetical protein